MLTELERMAIARVYAGADDRSALVRRLLPEAVVIEREFTGVGVYVTIRFPRPLRRLKPEEVFRNDWNFEHEELEHGGSFICWWTPEDGTELLLEGVAFGDSWPEGLDLPGLRDPEPDPLQD